MRGLVLLAALAASTPALAQGRAPAGANPGAPAGAHPGVPAGANPGAPTGANPGAPAPANTAAPAPTAAQLEDLRDRLLGAQQTIATLERRLHDEQNRATALDICRVKNGQLVGIARQLIEGYGRRYRLTHNDPIQPGRRRFEFELQSLSQAVYAESADAVIKPAPAADGAPAAPAAAVPPAPVIPADLLPPPPGQPPAAHPAASNPAAPPAAGTTDRPKAPKGQ